jgi:electron transfer flavoprotein beta subunit
MNVIVCLKRVPDVAEIDLQVDASGKSIKTEGLSYVLNDWDNYALEEAIRIKEKTGGKVYALTVGEEADEEVLRRALALGAEGALRVWDPSLSEIDPYVIALLLSKTIKDNAIPFDLILTGVQAQDDGYAQVGPILAELLSIPHVTLVNRLELQEKRVKVKRELEGGLEEELEVELPALFTIQSGINEPRYVSILGIKRVAKKEIKVLDLSALKLDLGEVLPKIKVEKLFPPPVGKGAEILKGSLDEISEKLLEIFEKGGVI